MRVISLKRLREFWKTHPHAQFPLRAWYRITLKADWASITDTRRTFPTADPVRTAHGTITVFNIAGNHYRLLAWVSYPYRRVTIESVLTHADYDKGTWKE